MDPVTVRTLLLRGVIQATVMTSDVGLDRTVTGITVAEVPDSPKWVSGGELLLSSGFCLRDQPDLLVKWIPEFATRNVAALAIKRGRFLPLISPKAIEVARQHDFCLLELPYETTWRDIISRTQPLLGGGLLSLRRRNVVQQIVHLLNEVVVRENHMCEVRSFLEQNACGPCFLEDSTGGIRVLGGEGTIPPSVRRLSPRLDNSPGPFESLFYLDGRECKTVTYAVPVRFGLLEWLSVSIPAGWTRHHMDMVKTRISAVEPLACRSQDVSLFDTLATAGHSEVVLAAASADLSESQPFMVVCAILPREVLPRGHSLKEQSAGPSWPGVVVTRVSATLLSYELEIIVQPAYSRATGSRLCDDLPNRLAGAVSSLVNVGARFGASSCYSDLQALGEANQEARIAARCSPMASGVCRFEDLGVLRLALKVLSPGTGPDLGHFQRIAKPICTADRDGELARTFRAYCECGFSMSRTAQSLYVHQNTVRYRLSLLERKGRVVLSDFAKLADAYVSLTICSGFCSSAARSACLAEGA